MKEEKEEEDGGGKTEVLSSEPKRYCLLQANRGILRRHERGKDRRDDATSKKRILSPFSFLIHEGAVHRPGVARRSDRPEIVHDSGSGYSPVCSQKIKST